MTTLFKEERQNWACFRRSATPSIPRWRGPSGPQFCVFFATYAYTVRPRTTKFGVVTRMGAGVLGQRHPRHCICTNASRGLSVTAEFLGFIKLMEVVRFQINRHDLALCTVSLFIP